MHDQSSSSPFPPRQGTPPDWEALGPAFRRLCDVVARLRAPDGCPWDREQSLETIKPCTLEETYELLEAIDSGDDADIVEELGDVLLQVVLDAQIGADEARFDLIQVVDRVTQKLIDRHPHVFGEAEAETAGEVRQQWDRIKQQQTGRKSLFAGLPAELPQLARAARVSAKAARVGYDFPDRRMLFDKLREEVEELAEELFADGQIPDVPATVDWDVQHDEPVQDPDRQARIENEIGDILFVIANIARRWQVNPEEALRKSNRKFERRFAHVEQALGERGRSLKEATLREMEDLYQEAKRREQARETGTE